MRVWIVLQALKIILFHLNTLAEHRFGGRDLVILAKTHRKLAFQDDGLCCEFPNNSNGLKGGLRDSSKHPVRCDGHWIR
jgi:hypothetical protein